MSRRRMRAQNEWNVPSVTLSAAEPGTIAATRSRISAAALFVKVMPAICSGGMPFSIMYAMRDVMTRVFPVPAPARTRSGPSI